jgi:hypothetical protein
MGISNTRAKGFVGVGPEPAANGLKGSETAPGELAQPVGSHLP